MWGDIADNCSTVSPSQCPVLSVRFSTVLSDTLCWAFTGFKFKCNVFLSPDSHFLKRLQLLKKLLSLKQKEFWAAISYIKGSTLAVQRTLSCVRSKGGNTSTFIPGTDIEPFSSILSQCPLTLRGDPVYFKRKTKGSEKKNIYWLTFWVSRWGANIRHSWSIIISPLGAKLRGTTIGKNPFCKICFNGGKSCKTGWKERWFLSFSTWFQVPQVAKDHFVYDIVMLWIIIIVKF